MKIQLLFIVLFFGFYFCQAQSFTNKKVEPYYIPSNVERYKKDYSIKGWNAIQDTSKINQLNLNYYDSIRNDILDLEVPDAATSLIVIVYSKIKATNNKE
ncbi:MAG: hypothetical protein HYX39_00310 [Bacteroidetes bacterium]|nr:hypothetical protein [Bacteroidota bacterium]